MHRLRTYVALTAAALLATASPALAQVCAGFPMNTGSTMGVASLGFPNNATNFGVGGMHKMSDQVTIGAAYTLTSYDDVFGVSVPSSHTIGVNGSYEIPVAAAEVEADLAVCPTAGLNFTSWDDVSAFSIPLGVSLGAGISIAEGNVLMAPYVGPQLVWSRTSWDGGSNSDTDLGFALGANFLFSNYLVGGGFSKVGDSKAVFALRFGMMF